MGNFEPFFYILVSIKVIKKTIQIEDILFYKTCAKNFYKILIKIQIKLFSLFKKFL